MSDGERPRGRAHPVALSGAGLTGADALCDAAGGVPGPLDAAAGDHPFAVDEWRRYEEVGELGQGGMGRVTAVLDRRLRRQVALKRVAADVRDRPAARSRFAREAWITASLDHPAIVPVFDAGVGESGELFYTMRLIRGRTLGDAIAGADGMAGRLALLRHFLLACEAIAYAHGQGVVHRDLKPDNILVAEFGQTQVVDWGVARRVDEEEDRRGPTIVDPHRTSAGAVVGTPAYMSPEQAAGAPPDPRADVYSLGAVLHEIVAGGARSPRAPLVEAAPELRAIAERALAEDLDERYPDARALAADVTRFLDGRRVTAHRYSPLEGLALWARRWRAPLAVAAIAALILVALGVWALVRTRAERDRAVAAEARAEGSLAVAARHLGRALVEQALAAQAVDAQPEAEVLAAEALALEESPDARGVLAAYGFAGRPVLAERLAAPRCDVIEPRADGAIACVREGVVSLHRGRPLVESWRRPLAARGATFVSHGRSVAVVDEGGHGVLLDAATGRTVAALGTGYFASLSFASGDSSDLVVSVNSATLTIVDGRAAAARTAAPCSTGVSTRTAGVGRRGTRIAVGCRDGEVAILDDKGAEVQRIATPFLRDRGDLAAVSLSPDGTLLVAASMRGEVVSYAVPSGATVATRATNHGVVRILVFSPDGERVALGGDRGGVAVWDPRSWAMLRRLPAEGDHAVVWTDDSGAAGPDAKYQLITAGPELRRWSLAPAPAVTLLAARPPGLAGADLSPRADRLALAAGDGTLRVLDTATGRPIFTDLFQADVLKGARFDPGGGLLVWASGRPSIRRYDAAGAVVETRDLGMLKRAALLPSGWLVAAQYARGAFLVEPAREAAPRPFGDQLFIDLDQAVEVGRALLLDDAGAVWRVDDGAPPRAASWIARPGARAVAISGDGRTAAVAGPGGVEILDSAGGGTRARIATDETIADLALSGDGALVATAELSRTAHVWSARDGRLLAVLRGHEARLATVRFSDGGRLLTTASWDGSARVWGLADLTRGAEALWRGAEEAWGVSLEAASAARLR